MHRRSCLREVSRSAATRFIRAGRDRARRAAGRVVLGSLVCAVSVMCATSARAQTQVTRTVVLDEQDFPFTDTNPCNNSVVSGQERIYEVFTIHSTEGSPDDITPSIHESGEGTKSGDTAEYKFQSLSEIRIRSSTQNFSLTIQLEKHVIRQGSLPPGVPKDDYIVQEKVTSSLHSPPSFNSDKSHMICK